MLLTILSVITPVIVILAIVARTVLVSYPRSSIPEHLTQHPVLEKENLIPPAVGQELVRLIKEMKYFPSNIASDLKSGGARQHDEIGEGMQILADGTCTHPLMVPNPSKTKCTFPQRVDVGSHFILTGGVEGKKEMFDDLVSRVTSFGKYHFAEELVNYPVIRDLFAGETFQSAAKTICPKDAQVLDPFQFNIIIQVPGQSVAAHLDAPWFWGATRFQFPQWLLAAMVFSGLFRDKFVDQVQVVGYLHEWLPNATDGGEFVFYNNDTSIGKVLPKPLAGSMVDGSKVVHAAKIYRPHVKAPSLPKDKLSSLDFVGGERWQLTVDGKPIRSYDTSDLRISIVYRARCFSSAKEKQRFQDLTSGDIMTLEYILQKMTDDLIKRGKLREEAKHSLSRLELAELIVKAYIKYPLPSVEDALIPYNYCAAGKLYPLLQPILQLICR